MSKLKLGTRRSMLAWAQSGWVAREIERLNPGVSVELVGIETRGDRILDISLRSVEGKEFFVAELDQALKTAQVDLTVHSMKDLSLERPEEFVLAAIPRRANPRDAVLFGPGVMEKIARGQVLKIGTSSPRRLENIPPFLLNALPRVGGVEPRVELIDIRGNVNTRLARVHPEMVPADKQLDGVVLALAGLARLWNDGPGRAELQKLLRGVRWMVLPLRECPAAPAQGALAIECRAHDSETRAILGRLHDPRTAAHVARERALLAEWGGGCHQRFGATAVAPAPELSELFYVRGVKPNDEFIEAFDWEGPSKTPGPAWDGNEQRSGGEQEWLNWDASATQGRAVFVSHSRAASHAPADWSEGARVWTSGTSSWFRLAAQGVWVEGCSEGLGFESLVPTLEEGVFQLPLLKEWTILTHEAALADWSGARPIATYRLKGGYSAETKAALRTAKTVFWSSASQFDALKDCVAQTEVRHACGPGKTASRLRERGIDPVVFPGHAEWKKWKDSL